MLWLLEWVVHTACALHDAQNAFKWGIAEKFDNSELLKAVYIGSCSVRNSTNIIITYLAEWATVSIQQVAPLDEATTNQFRLLWSTLGLDKEVIHVLVDVLELRMEGDKLLVTRGCPSHDLTSIVVSVLMAVWRARKFTDSRWLSMGRSARALVASRLTGLPSLLEYSSRKPSVSTYYLGGFLRLTEEHWLFLVECALVARVPEVAQEALLRDNRVAFTAPKIKAEMEVATKTLAELPASLWAVLATIGGTTGPLLQGDCLKYAYRVCAFMQFRVFDSAEALPWTLCRGDVISNLRDLHAGPRPACCEVSGKAWDLLDVGYPIHTVGRMVELLAEVPWTTAVTEQLHASAAVISRFHPEYSLCTLLARAMSLATARLLPTASKVDKVIRKCKAKLKKLSRSCPEKASGRQLFFSDLCKVAKDKFIDGGLCLKHVRKKLMKTHSAFFKQRHSAATRAVYRQRARAAAASKRLELLRQRRVVAEGLCEARQRAAREALLRGPLQLSSAAWGEWEPSEPETWTFRYLLATSPAPSPSPQKWGACKKSDVWEGMGRG